MANFNMASIKKIVAKLELTDIQLIPSTNPNNCSKILYKGKEYKSSQWTKAEAFVILSELKEGNTCEVSANEDRETGDEIIARYIDMQNRTFNSVLTEYISKNNFSYEQWLDTLFNFYNTDDKGRIINKDFKVEVIANKLLQDKVMIYNNQVLTQKGLEYLIKAWHNENIEKITSAKAEMLSYRVMDKLKALV